ncbi:MAG: LysR family transcriptional regulator [Bacteriovoracaceae bacterium]
MDLSSLKYFYEVARLKSFTKAALELGLAQPSVTRGVKNLEDQLGIPLFERIGKKVHLTSAGHDVFEVCEKIFAEAEEIRQIAEAQTKKISGPFKFGASSPISTYLIPGVLQDFMKEFPETWPMMYSATGEELVRKIRSAELEFGLFLHVPEDLLDLQRKTIQKLKFHLVASSKKKNLDRFIGSREIEETRNKKFPALERLKKDYPEAKISISTNDISAHKEMALKGLGVAILPEFMISDELKKGTLLDLYPKEEFIFPLVLLTRKNGIISRAAKEFLDRLV